MREVTVTARVATQSVRLHAIPVKTELVVPDKFTAPRAPKVPPARRAVEASSQGVLTPVAIHASTIGADAASDCTTANPTPISFAAKTAKARM